MCKTTLFAVFGGHKVHDNGVFGSYVRLFIAQRAHELGG